MPEFLGINIIGWILIGIYLLMLLGGYAIKGTKPRRDLDWDGHP
jgi:hypothetical protein